MDKQAVVLASKKYLLKIGSRLSAVETKMATQSDMADLKNYINESFESVTEDMDNLFDKLAEKEKAERLIEWAKNGYISWG